MITEPDGMRDLVAMREYPVRPPIVLVPKVESPRDIEIVARLLRPVRPDLELCAVIETPRGVEAAAAIAATSPRLRALIFGSADYASALGAQLRRWTPDEVDAHMRFMSDFATRLERNRASSSTSRRWRPTVRSCGTTAKGGHQ